MRTHGPSTLFPTVLLFAACAAAPEPELVTPAATVHAATAGFPGADALLRGFSPRTKATSWQKGDAVLFGLELTKGSQVHRWLLHLEVQDMDRIVGTGSDGRHYDVPILKEQRAWSYNATIRGEKREMTVQSAMRDVAVRVCDANGTELGASKVKLPVGLMTSGLVRAVTTAIAHHRHDPEFQNFQDPSEVQPMVEGLVALIALLNVVQNDHVLEPYFWEVVQKPSIWSVVTGLGVSASITGELQNSVPATDLPYHMTDGHPAFVMPLHVDVNGAPALLADVATVDPNRPYGLCGGIVGATARHPTRKDLQFTVRLLAARLGDETR